MVLVSCSTDVGLINVILVNGGQQSSFIPYCHDDSIKVFTSSRWQSIHHCYIFMEISYSYFVLPSNLSIILPDKSHSKHP
jgi:hypothetical protein